MAAARRQGDNVRSGIRCFDADHGFIFIIPEILHAPGFVDPWVPDDGRTAAFFGNADASIQTVVFDGARGRRIGVDAIGFTLDIDGPLLYFTTPLIDFVEIGTVFETLPVPCLSIFPTSLDQRIK
jgi:hypothetical protein